MLISIIYQGYVEHWLTCYQGEETNAEDKTDAYPSGNVFTDIPLVVAGPHCCLVTQNLMHYRLIRGFFKQQRQLCGGYWLMGKLVHEQ